MRLYDISGEWSLVRGGDFSTLNFVPQGFVRGIYCYFGEQFLLS